MESAGDITRNWRNLEGSEDDCDVKQSCFLTVLCHNVETLVNHL